MTGKRFCDWSQCVRVADFHVRVDVPREDGGLFTSLMWVRCGDHVPTNPAAIVSPLGGVS